jgi:hypothetical protein
MEEATMAKKVDTRISEAKLKDMHHVDRFTWGITSRRRTWR